MSTGRTLSARPIPVTEIEEPVSSPESRQTNLQDAFLNLLRKNKTSVTIFLVKGVKLHDAEQFNNQGSNRKQRLLQDVFLSRVSEANVEVTMFLVNGVMLQGRIAAYDLFCMLLERDGMVQLSYKHAVSTIQPASAVDLTDDWEGDED